MDARAQGTVHGEGPGVTPQGACLAPCFHAVWMRPEKLLVWVEVVALDGSVETQKPPGPTHWLYR